MHNAARRTAGASFRRGADKNGKSFQHFQRRSSLRAASYMVNKKAVYVWRYNAVLRVSATSAFSA